MIGRSFGRVTVIAEHGRSPWGEITWKCSCSCGGIFVTLGKRLRAGTTTSCGCYRREFLLSSRLVHGMRNSSEYGVWAGMKTRCHNPRSKDFPKYGGRGIKVFKEWRKSFDAFYQHIGPRPVGTTIDRIDGTKGYVPGNVRWASALVQGRNKSNAVYVRCSDGSVLRMQEIASRLGITQGAAHMRYKRGKLHV